MTFDLTPFLAPDATGYRVRFSRHHDSSNSGLIYADAEIRRVAVISDGWEVLSLVPEAVRLTTRYKAKVVNPWVDFVYDETRASVRLEGLRIPAARKKVELVVDVVLRNPGNQWGDRIQLYTYLQPEDSRQ